MANGLEESRMVWDMVNDSMEKAKMKWLMGNAAKVASYHQARRNIRPWPGSLSRRAPSPSTSASSSPPPPPSAGSPTNRRR